MKAYLPRLIKLAQDIATTLGNFTDSDGIVTTRSEGATEDLANHKEEDLFELEKEDGSCL